MIKEATTIFWAPEGGKLSWNDGVFHIEDLNPSVSIKWRITPAELQAIGERCLKLAQDAMLASARGSREMTLGDRPMTDAQKFEALNEAIKAKAAELGLVFEINSFGQTQPNFLVSEDNQRTQAVWLIGVHAAK
jgi:hypothetical protein